jgi:phosphoribosyl 1,2-cyclic phosphodiesterase
MGVLVYSPEKCGGQGHLRRIHPKPPVPSIAGATPIQNNFKSDSLERMKGNIRSDAHSSKCIRVSIAIRENHAHHAHVSLMLHLTVLASGSSGNCALVETPDTRVLVDAGLSAKRVAEKLATLGVAPDQLDAILLTHEHSDHAAAVGVWGRRHGTPVFANRLTAEALSSTTKGVNWKIFQTGCSFDLGSLQIQSFSIPHDAAEPVGFVLGCGGQALGFLTDLGFPTRMVIERVRSVHTLVIEANHDEKMLQEDTRRPWSTKQRIMSRHGHLSNAAAAEVLADIAGNNLRRALLGHLSEDCNTPELALRTVRERLAQNGENGVEVLCASSPGPLERLVVG